MKWTAEHLANLRAANSKPRTAAHRRKLGLAHKGKPSWNKGIKGSVPGKSADPVVEAERRRKIAFARRGMKFSKKHRERLALVHIGKCPNWKNPAERARKISLAQRGKPASRKKLLAIRRAGRLRRIHKLVVPHHVEVRFRYLRLIVLTRDKRTCIGCGEKVHIVVHHIDHNHGHNWLDNLVTACRGCNRRAELPKWKAALEKKFKAYTVAITYPVAA